MKSVSKFDVHCRILDVIQVRLSIKQKLHYIKDIKIHLIRKKAGAIAKRAFFRQPLGEVKDTGFNKAVRSFTSMNVNVHFYIK